MKVLGQIEHIASRHHASGSQPLTQALEGIAASAEEYAHARARLLAWLEHGADLGTLGRTIWSRESLHETD